MNRIIPALILASGLAASCQRDRNSQSTGPRRPAATTQTVSATPPPSRAVAPGVTPEARILSILHAKNEEEMNLGRLAHERGQTDEVKQFGEQLVQDHTDLDQQVSSTAQAAGIALMDPNDVKWMLAREKGTVPGQDPVYQLSTMSEADFDREFSQRMRSGHQELIYIVEQARKSVTNPEVASLLDETLPRLHTHHQTAQRLTSAAGR